MMRKGMMSELISLESSVNRPIDEIIHKIQNLPGLLDCTNSGWRNTDRKPEINIKKHFRNDSFQSLPSSPTSNRNPPKSYPKASPIAQYVRYVSKYKNNEQQVEDKILNTIILSKLNKFSVSTYNEIRDFLRQILGSSNEVTSQDKENIEDFVKEFMNLVFKKAASEENFCSLYAKLLGEISKEYPIILDEMNKLHENYLDIFDECDDATDKDYDSFVLKNKEKKYRQGYSQFLSELTSIGILSVDKLTVIFEKIFTQIFVQSMIENKSKLIEEYIDCLLRITKVLHNRKEPNFIEIRDSLMIIVKKSVETIERDKHLYLSLSNKSRFLLMNIQDNLKGE